MDPEEVEERMAMVRLEAALMDHIAEVEPVPDEVRQAVREMYRERLSE